MTELLIKALLSYLLGSVMGSLVIRRITGGVDIRNLGSGNAGATNALRTQGKMIAFWVLLIDLAKGWIATGKIAPWIIPHVSPALPDLEVWASAVCGIAVMLGHVYPVWFGFRGGKGVATLVGAVLGLGAGLLVPMILSWLIAVIVWGFVGLASIIGAAAFAMTMALRNDNVPLLTFGIAATLLIIYTHRGNIARMRAGTEPHARRLWLFGRHRSQA
jgi:acyl phosphate:glycerol-3-phosphate acyltransferase